MSFSYSSGTAFLKEEIEALDKEKPLIILLKILSQEVHESYECLHAMDKDLDVDNYIDILEYFS